MRATLWGGVLGGSLILSLAYSALGLSLDSTAALPQLLILGLTLAVAVVRPRLAGARERRLADGIELTGLFCWLSLLGGLASYAVAAGSTGFRDADLAALDAALGFDWTAAYAQVAARPWLGTLAGLAYRSIFVSPLVVIAALVWAGRSDRAERFLLAFASALAVALLVFHFWPARSALAHHIGLGAGYLPATGIAHVALIDGLRGGLVTAIDPQQIVGMITFPSFHAVCAVLFVWAGWPVRAIRWPLFAVNAAMLAATPVEGTHYLVDVIAGVALAIVAILLVRRHTPGGAPAAFARAVTA